MKVTFTLLFFTVLLTIDTKSQTLDKKIASTNGPVYATAVSGDTVYIGGDFTQVGTGAKKLAKFNADSDKPDISFPELGGTDKITAMESDGAGGFYLAGYFDNYNGAAIAETYIIHVLAGGTLDPAFEPVAINYGNKTIFTLKKVKNRLYVGGWFSSVQNTTRSGLAALDATNAHLINWVPEGEADAVVQVDANDSLVFANFGVFYINNFIPDRCMVLKASSGQLTSGLPTPSDGAAVTAFTIDRNTLYMGGNFTSLSSPTAYLSKAKATDASGDPAFPVTDGTINDIIPDGSGGYYVAGQFSVIGGISRNNIAHVLANNQIDPVFNPDVNNYISSLTADGSNIYLSGGFTAVNGQVRNHVASCNKSNGILTVLDPNVNGPVWTMAISNGILYFGGKFSTVKSVTRNYAAGYDIAANALTSWNPNLNLDAHKILPAPTGSSIFICGAFTTVDGNSIPYATKVNNVTGKPVVSWKPGPNNYIYSAILVDSVLYAKGLFTLVNGKPRYYFAALDTSVNNPKNLRADLSHSQYGDVNDFAVNNNKLYIGGVFATIQDSARTNIARIDLATGLVDTWNGGDLIQPNATVWAVEAASNDVILGGDFTASYPVARDHLAAVDISNNSFKLKSWQPSGGYFQSYNSIYSFYRYKKNIFTSGFFTYFDGNAQSNNIVALDTTTGAVTYNFSKKYPNAGVSVTGYNDRLFIAGRFTEIDSIGVTKAIRRNLASYNLVNFPNVQLENYVYDPNNDVYGMITDNSGNLFISGTFDLLNYIDRESLAAINLKTGSPTSFNPDPYVSSTSFGGSNIYALTIKDTILFAGGYFTQIGSNGLPRNNLGAVDIRTGKATSWNANTDYEVYCLAIKDTLLYAGGNFTTVKGASRGYAAAVSVASGALKSWNPSLDNATYSILPDNNNVYLAGPFTKVGTTNRKYLAKVDASTAALAAWTPNPNSVVNILIKDSSSLYAGGGFSSIAATPLYGVAKFSLSADSVYKEFNPRLRDGTAAPSINGLGLWGTTLFTAAASLTKINGVNRGNLAAVDVVKDSATLFNPQPDAVASYIGVDKNKLMAGGNWYYLGTKLSPSYFAVYTLEPLQQATGLNFTQLQATSVTANFTPGSGDNRLVVIRQGALPVAPLDGKGYTASPVYKSGDSTGVGSFVVYSGPSSSVAVSGLLPNHAYSVSVFEYNGSNSASDYLVVPVLSGSFTTPCPSYNLTINPSGPTTFCTGDSVKLGAPNGFSSYLWSNGKTTKQIKVTTAGSYSVTFTDSNGCSGTTPVVNVVVNAIPATPTISASGSTTLVCPGKTVTLTSSAGATYLWSTGATTQSIVVSTAGSYSVKVTNATGCQSASSAATVVTYNTCAKPTGLVTSNITTTAAKLSWAAVTCAVGYQYEYRVKGTIPYTVGQVTGISKTITGLTAGTTYQWRVVTACKINPDTITSNGYTNGPEFTTLSAAFAGNDGGTGLDLTIGGLSASVMPNPARSMATVRVGNATGVISIKLTDLSGKLLWQSKASSQTSFDIDVSRLAQGSYMIMVRDDKESQTLKLVKE